MHKRINPASILRIAAKFTLNCLIILLLSGVIFGMAFIVGILIYVFTGNDAVLRFMSDVLNRILEVRTYFS